MPVWLDQVDKQVVGGEEQESDARKQSELRHNATEDERNFHRTDRSADEPRIES